MRPYIRLVLVVMAFAMSRSGRAAEPPEEPVYQGKTRAEWVGELKAPAVSTRRAVAEALHVFGPAKGVVPALAAALKDDYWEVLFTAAQTLGKFGPRAREALPALKAALKRVEAEPQPGGYPPPGSAAAESRAKARRAIAEALVLIDNRPSPALAPALLEAFKSDDAGKRRAAVMALAKLGPDAAKVTAPALIGGLQDGDNTVRLEAIHALGRIGPAAKPALHALTLLMKKGYRERMESARMIPAPDTYNPSEIRDTYRVVYHQSNKELCVACAEALGRIRPEAKGKVAAMRMALRDLDEYVRGAALFVLTETVKDAAELLPVIRPLLRDKNDALRQAALEAVAGSQGSAKQVVPALAAALKDESMTVRARAAELLAKRGKDAKPAVPALLTALKDAEPLVRSAAAESLGAVAAQDKEVIGALLSALDDREDSVFGAAAVALSKSGQRARAAVPRLLALTKSPDARQRATVCFLLGYFGPTAKDALPALEKLSTTDPRELVRLAAHFAMAKVDASRSKETVRLLSAALGSKDADLAQAALKCLGFLGPQARAALPALRALRESTSDFAMRSPIDSVIEEIQKSEKGSPR